MIIHIAPPVVCWPWHLRDLDPAKTAAHPKGARCIHCARDVAMYGQDRRGVCIYCALDRGLTPAIDMSLIEEAA